MAALVTVLPTASFADWCHGAKLRRFASRTATLQVKLLGLQRSARGGSQEEDEDGEADTTNVELFRQSLLRGWGSKGIGSADRGAMKTDWAEVISPDSVRPGDLLLAHPEGFVGEEQGNMGTLRVGMLRQIPEDYPRRETLRLLPVVLVTEISSDGTTEGVTLGRRSGSLMGDYVNFFHSQPLLIGGPHRSSIKMLHPYPQVPESTQLGEDVNLFVSTNFAGAQDWVENGEGSSLRFRFFANSVHWEKGELQKELGSKFWLPLRCSPELVFSEVDGPRAKSLWAQVVELAGGEAEELAKEYGLM